jgi:hypothetical protein
MPGSFTAIVESICLIACSVPEPSGAQGLVWGLAVLVTQGNAWFTFNPHTDERLRGVSSFDPHAGQGAARHTKQNEKVIGHDILLPAYARSPGRPQRKGIVLGAR